MQNEPASIDRAGAPASEPGLNQVLLEPGNQVGRGTGEGEIQLDDAGWDLFEELEAFCGAGTPEQRRHWGWRIWKNASLVERALREVQLTVREGRYVRSRAGLIKTLWTAWGKAAETNPVRQIREDLPTDGYGAAEPEQPISEAEQRALYLRLKAEFAKQFPRRAGGGSPARQTHQQP